MCKFAEQINSFSMKTNSLKVSLRALRFHSYHGLLPQERTVGNDYEVDIDMEISGYEAATLDDDISGTVDYSAVYKAVGKVMDNPQRLIERVGYMILETIFSGFPKVERARVKVSKLVPPIEGDCHCASVELSAER